MILKLVLLVCTSLSLIIANNDTCPTTPPRRFELLQCYTYPRSSCVTDIGLYSNTTLLYLGNSSVVNLETELRLFEVLFRQLSNFTDTEESCQRYFQTLACLYLYSPCHEGRPLRFCEVTCNLVQNSRCRLDSGFFSAISTDANTVIFEELRIPGCSTINERVDSYPQIEGIDYNQSSNCTNIGLPGAINALKSGDVKLVTDSTHDSANIYETSAHGVVQVLNFDADIWGDVCIVDGTSQDEIRKIAEVACRSINFPAGPTKFEVGPPANSSGFYMIDEIRCNGNETSLSLCDHNGYDFKFCPPNKRLHVTCNKDVGTLVLGQRENSANSIAGIPTIKLEGFVTAQFCADTFNDSIANVICNNIEDSLPNITATYYGIDNSDNAELTTFSCQGSESRVLQCIQNNETCPSNRRVLLSCNRIMIGTHTTLDLSSILTPINIIIIVASFIILILVLVIIIFLCGFCSYRKETKKKIQDSEMRASNTGQFYMRQLDYHGSNLDSLPRIINNGIYTNPGTTDIDQESHQGNYNLPSINLPNDSVTAFQFPGSPIQNYMVTTLGVESLPTDHLMSISFLQDYCGADIKSYVIPGARLEMGTKLGEGAFGLVYKGRILDRIEGESDDVEPHAEVAVKTLKDPENDRELKDLLIECALLKDLQHTNILGLLAVTYFGNRPYLIIPYMANGDLKGYLKSVREKALNSLELPEDLSEKLLAAMSLDIVRGMEYLTNKRYVHRDLAARNCMVDANFSIKVSDFGLSREIYVDDYYRQKGGKLPAKWMAPECLGDGISNEKTDAWSFGVTLWEVYSLGRNPYPGVSNSEMLAFLELGKRMEQPRLCPPVMYELMQYCWQHKPMERPTFTIITKYLESLKFDQREKTESNKVTFVAIQEEEDKLHDIEYTEDSPSRKTLQRQDAIQLRTNTPFTPSQPVSFEHLASRIEETTRKAFLMQCLKSVSMDSSRFEAGGSYTIPHLSMSIPIIDEDHRERTKSLFTARKKHTTIMEALKKKRHTIAEVVSESPVKATRSAKLKVNQKRRISNSARVRWRNSARKGKEHSFFSHSHD